MSTQQTIRAWKDPAYRRQLDSFTRENLAASPAGRVELNDSVLKASRLDRPIITTAITCTQFTFFGWKACCRE